MCAMSVTAIGSTPAARANASTTPTTPEAAARAFSSSGDVLALGTFLNEVPAAARSRAAVKVIDASAGNPEGLRKLATEGFATIAVALNSQPTDPGVTQAITTLMQARNGGAAAPTSKPSAARPSEPATPSSRPWLGNDGLRRTYGKGIDLPQNMAQAVNKDGYVDAMDTSGRVAMAVTRGVGTNRTVGVLCSFEVGLTNPKTGAQETVLFKGVEDHRKAPFGFGKYDTSKDYNSDVLVCTGQEYERGRPNPRDPMQMVSGSMTAVSALDYRSIPDLKRRVEHYLKTGDTGNSTAKK